MFEGLGLYPGFSREKYTVMCYQGLGSVYPDVVCCVVFSGYGAEN